LLPVLQCINVDTQDTGELELEQTAAQAHFGDQTRLEMAASERAHIHCGKIGGQGGMSAPSATRHTARRVSARRLTIM
jgi:hypothetical protein